MVGKRGPGKVKTDYTLDDIYKYYISEHKEDEFFVTIKDFKKIINTFNKKIVSAMLDDSQEFKMPYRLGTLRIKKTKMNFNSENECWKIDWATTKKCGKKVFHMNDHTNNHRYRFYWNKAGCNAKNVSAYSYDATRANKRKLAHILKNNITDYYL